MMDQLRGMRQPCRKVRCSNPAHEDGYCDTHRPFDSKTVPIREDWLTGDGLIKSNNPAVRTTEERLRATLTDVRPLTSRSENCVVFERLSDLHKPLTAKLI